MTRAEERALEAYPITGKWIGNQYGEWDPDINRTLRAAHQQGYEQAEKDILSKITKEHLDGLKWIERTGITSQPYPYHKYCKDLRKILETLLNDD